MKLENPVSLDLTSLDSLATSDIFEDVLSDNIISYLPVMNSILSILSISDFSNFSCVIILAAVVAILSVIVWDIYVYNLYQSIRQKNLSIIKDILLMDTPANDRAFNHFIRILIMKVGESDRNRDVDLRFFKPGLRVEYRSLTKLGSVTTRHTRTNEYMIIDNNDRYGIAILAMKEFNNRGLVVVKYNGEWVVGCLYEGSDRYVQTDLITGDRFRSFPVLPIWFSYHNTFTRSFTSKGRPLTFDRGQKTTTIYEIERLNLQRRFYE